MSTVTSPRPRFRSLLVVAAWMATACGATAPRVPQPVTGPPPRVAAEADLPQIDGREIRLVGRYAHATVDVRLGDPGRDPGYVVLFIGHRAVRLGLTPRPAEERDRLLDETVEVRGLFALRAPALPPMPNEVPTNELTGFSGLPVLEPLNAPEPVPIPTASAPVMPPHMELQSQ